MNIESVSAKEKAAAKTAANQMESSGHRAGNSRRGIRVRMYRQGLGDCFLITLPKADRGNCFVMIDCGVILGTPEAGTKMRRVVEDISTVTGGNLDLLVATHEHWDHLSGFLQAQDLFEKLAVKQVWLSWTEDPDDGLGKELRNEHIALRNGLAAASVRMRLGGSANNRLDSMLEFFGAKGQGTTSDALKFVKTLCRPQDLHYCRPSDPPRILPQTSARFYVLGPPHDKKMIMKYNPSKAHPETYGLAMVESRAFQLMSNSGGRDAPFDNVQQIPLAATVGVEFFRRHYWGADQDYPDDGDQEWRRIDSEWLDQASSLALQLDNATNNTSLALAIELEDGDVLLFAADAQVGNWLSWQELSWKDSQGKLISGPDLLKRTVLYKVGHHCSHNATLREKGLEQMESLFWALIPVDHAMALKKGWGKMPLPELERALKEKTQGRLIRVDDAALSAAAANGGATMTDLFIEVGL